MVLTRAQRRKLHDLIDDEMHRENVANVSNLRKRKKFGVQKIASLNTSVDDVVLIDDEEDDDDEIFEPSECASSTSVARPMMVDSGSGETTLQNLHLGRSSTKTAADMAPTMTSYNNLCSNFVLGDNNRHIRDYDSGIMADEDTSNGSTSSTTAANCTCYFLNLRKGIHLRKFSDVAHDIRHMWWRSTAATAVTFTMTMVLCTVIAIMFWLRWCRTTLILTNTSKSFDKGKLSVDRGWRMFAFGFIKHIFFD